MLWYLFSSAFLAFFGVGFDRFWTNCLIRSAFPIFSLWPFRSQDETVCWSPRTIAMGLMRFLGVLSPLRVAHNDVVPTTAATALLPAYPLAVKNPYLSAWVPGNQISADAATAQPMFWNGINLTWPIVARVDGQTYSLFGVPHSASNATVGWLDASTSSVSYTSSHTYVRLTAGSANFVLDFFSPVLPGQDEYAKQSLPYSYLTISASTTRSKGAKVQVMSGIDYTWTAQNGASQLNYTKTNTSGYFQFYNPDQFLFTEVRDMATWGSFVFGSDFDYNMSAGCGAAADVYSTFASQGCLDRKRLQSKCDNLDLAAVSKDLGIIGPTASSTTFIVGFDRINTINYLGDAQTGFYRTKWSTIPDAVDYVLEDYSTFLDSSLSFDAAVRTKARSVSNIWGSKYADIVEASVRQTFGGMDLTVT